MFDWQISYHGQFCIQLLNPWFCPLYQYSRSSEHITVNRAGSLNRNTAADATADVKITRESRDTLNDRCRWFSSVSLVVQKSPRESLFKDCYFVSGIGGGIASSIGSGINSGINSGIDSGSRITKQFKASAQNDLICFSFHRYNFCKKNLISIRIFQQNILIFFYIFLFFKYER